MRRLLPEPVGDVDLDVAYGVSATPHLRVNFVSSVDGAATASGLSAGLSGPGDRLLFATLRGLCDAVVVGAGTARKENYGGAKPSPQRREKRRAAGFAEVPPIVVVTDRLALDPSSRLFTDTSVPPVVVTCERSARARAGMFTGIADLVVAGAETVDLAAAVGMLHERGLPRLLCEGGPHLFAALLAAGLVDELCLTLSPRLVGGDAPRIVDGAVTHGAMRLDQVLEEDGFLFLRYSTAAGAVHSEDRRAPEPPSDG